MRKFNSRIRFAFIPLAVAAFFGISFIVMQLWNGILPEVLHAGLLTFWQAMGLLVLCKLLFGFGKGRRFGSGPFRWDHAESRFKNMTPEEKEQFKEKIKQRCGGRNWGRGDSHYFEAEWDNHAAGAAAPKE